MWCGCTTAIILSCARPHLRSVTRKHRPLLRVHYNFRQAVRLRRHLANVEPALSRVRCQSRHRGPAIVKTRSRQLVRVDRQVFQHSRTGGDDNAVCPRRVRPHGGGGCGNSEQSDSHETSNRSMPRHQNLRGPKCPLAWVMGTARKFNSNATSNDHANSRIGQRRCPKFKIVILASRVVEELGQRQDHRHTEVQLYRASVLPADDGKAAVGFSDEDVNFRQLDAWMCSSRLSERLSSIQLR
jgi:hypothetical protein